MTAAASLAESWIGDSGCPRITDYSDSRTRSKLLHEFRRPRGLIVLVIAGRTRGYSVMIEQLLRLTGVLAGDEINLLQHSNGAQGNVFEIADRRGNEVEARSEWFVRRHTGEFSTGIPNRVEERPFHGRVIGADQETRR